MEHHPMASLAEQTSKETDPAKLIRLVKELCRALNTGAKRPANSARRKELGSHNMIPLYFCLVNRQPSLWKRYSDTISLRF
jgi:hypothetical protein